MTKELFEKIELFASADENGKYWEIEGKRLSAKDLVELANWIAVELGWLKRS